MGLNKRLISTAAAGVVNTENFAPIIYTGNRVDASTTNPQTVGFQPDFVWQKIRTQPYNHILLDSIRGGDNALYSNDTSQETNGTTNNFGGIDFVSNGVIINSANYTVDILNKFGDNMVAWCWKAGGTAVSNTDGTITSTVSANQDAGFSIATFTTPTNNNFSIGHGLNLAPELVFLKSRSGGSSWTTYAQPIGATKYLFLNSTAAATTSALPFNDTPPTDSVINLGSATVWYGTSADWVAYCFHSVDGYQKIGSYTGTGSSGNSVTTGFEPRFLMMKATNANEDWVILDAARNTSDPRNTYIMANLANAEFSNTSFNVNFDATGFTINGTAVHINGSGTNYIYLAIA